MKKNAVVVNSACHIHRLRHNTTSCCMLVPVTQFYHSGTVNTDIFSVLTKRSAYDGESVGRLLSFLFSLSVISDIFLVEENKSGLLA